MSSLKFKEKAVQCSIEVYDDKAVVKRGLMGRLSTGGGGEKTFIFNKLSGVEFKKASMVMNGYIQFSGSGLKQSSGTLNAASNENTVMFSRSANDKFKEISDFINAQLSKPQQNTVVQQSSDADELLKFKNLMDNGIISAEEFEAKKKQLLGL